jgi:uncharacterized protein (DUF885 family)
MMTLPGEPYFPRAGRWLTAGALVVLLAACGSDDTDAGGPSGERTSAASAQAVAAIAKGYFARRLELDPLLASELGDTARAAEFGDYLSATWLADSLANEQDTAAALRAIDPARLPARARLTRAALLSRSATEIEGFRYPSELLLLDPFDDLPVRFAREPRLGATAPLADVAAYEAYLQRLDGFVAWADQAINNLRLGLAKEVVHPRVIVERSLPDLAAVAAARPAETAFWAPLRSFPAAVPMTERARLARELEQQLRERVLPAYARLHRFLGTEYLPQARESVAFAELPGGVAWYAYLARANSQTAATPAELHAAALARVAEWRSRTPASPGVLPPLPVRPNGFLLDRVSGRAWLAFLSADAPADGAPVSAAGVPPTRALHVAALAAVDTGVHAQGWTREHAIEWLVRQLGIDGGAAAEHVDRCIAQPARALAAFAGLGFFAELRRSAIANGGGAADHAEFSRRVAESLWMPLPVLGTAVLDEPSRQAQ